MKNLVRILLLMCVFSFLNFNLYATDLSKTTPNQTLNKNSQLLNALMKTIKNEGYVLLNLHRDSYTLVIPTSNNFSKVLQNLKGENFLSQEQLDDFSVLWDKTKENGGIGVLEHKKIQTQGQEIARTTPKIYSEPRVSVKPQAKDEIYYYLEQRAIMLKEVVEYHKAIKKAKIELDELKKERKDIQKRLLFLKQLLANNGAKQTLSSK